MLKIKLCAQVKTCLQIQKDSKKKVKTVSFFSAFQIRKKKKHYYPRLRVCPDKRTDIKAI